MAEGITETFGPQSAPSSNSGPVFDSPQSFDTLQNFSSSSPGVTINIEDFNSPPSTPSASPSTSPLRLGPANFDNQGTAPFNDGIPAFDSFNFDFPVTSLAPDFDFDSMSNTINSVLAPQDAGVTGVPDQNAAVSEELCRINTRL